MAQMMIFSGAIMLGLALLAWSSDRFVDGASSIAKSFGISPLVIGLTIVAFSTSAPEILVSAVSAWQGNNGIAIGNAVGSNIANMTLVLGVAALLMPIKVGPQTLNRETPLLLAAMLFALVILILDNTLSRVDGMILMTAMALVIYLTISIARKQKREENGSEATSSTVSTDQEVSGQVIWWLVSGLLVLLISAKMLVWGAVGIAEALGISDLVIGLTIVAVGTSLPELAASITAIKKGEHDMAVGNVIGSSLFNILAVLGVVGIVGPNPFDHAVVVRDYPIMIGLVVIFYLFTRRVPKDGAFTIQRWLGGSLLLLFFIYQSVILFGDPS